MSRQHFILHDEIKAEIGRLESGGEAGFRAAGRVLAVIVQLETYGRRFRPVQERRLFKKLLGFFVYLYVDDIYEMYYCELSDGAIFIVHVTTCRTVRQRDRALKTVKQRLAAVLAGTD